MCLFPVCLRFKSELRMMTSTSLFIALRFGLYDNIVFSNFPGSSSVPLDLMDDEDLRYRSFLLCLNLL